MSDFTIDAPGVSRPPVDPDPDMAAPPKTSLLEDLRADLAEPPKSEPITLTVPGRDGYEVRFSTAVSYEQYSAWRKKAKDDKKLSGFDELHFSSVVLANTCEAIIRHGVEIPAEDGTPLTFADDTFRDMVGAARAPHAVQKFFGRDADVVNASWKVLEAAGYLGGPLETDEEDDEGPTPG